MRFLIPCCVSCLSLLLVQQSSNDMTAVEMGRAAIEGLVAARPVSFTLIMIWIIEIRMRNNNNNNTQPGD